MWAKEWKCANVNDVKTAKILLEFLVNQKKLIKQFLMINWLINHYFSQPYKHTHTHPFNSPFSGTMVSRYQKGKTNLDFTEARDTEWQWHQLDICKSAPCSRQITMPAPHHSSFLQARCPSCHPTNSVKALKAKVNNNNNHLTAVCEGKSKIVFK